MRIAMIGQKGLPATWGGVERHVHDLSVHLAKLNHSVTVYGRSWYTKNKGDIIIDQVRVKHLPSINTKHLDTFTHVLISTLHALTQKYDVIHYHGVGPALVAWIPRLILRNTKIIITFHSIDRYDKKWGALAKIMLRLGEKAAVWFGDETITVSNSLKNYCHNEFNRETTYIPNGVNAILNENTNPENTALQSILDQFYLKKNKYLLMVARLIPNKGAHVLIEAFSRLKDQSPNPEIRELKLVIVGGSPYASEYVKNLHIQASAYNDIVFTDYQNGENLKILYQNTRALIHPSFNEGLPITVLEAMNFGKPVMLSNIPEHLELVKNPTMIFNHNNVTDLIVKLENFLSLSAEKQNDFGRENMSIIENNYRWDAIVPKILAVYRTTAPLKLKVQSHPIR